MTATEKETRSFRPHAKLLSDVIKRQAGTLMKAILEGVMNSVDAGATECRVEVTEKSVTIVDDGKGITDRQQINDHFDTFGQPHETSEGKTYGTFRMGRGQMFAFGRNVWRTGPFSMVVDIERNGLDYELVTLAEKPGCDIVIELYSKLYPGDLAETVNTLKKWVKYAPIRVVVNGERADVDPKEEAWDFVTDDAYVRLGGLGSLMVYNLGVYAKDFYGSYFGTAGTVVSRQQLKLNFARNDIQSDCPVWKKVKALIEAEAGKAIVKKKALTDDERQRMVDLVKVNPELADRHTLKLFTAVTGRHFSAQELSKARHQFNGKMTVAPKGDVVGDRVHQQKIAFVMATETIKAFGCEKNPAQIVEKISAMFVGRYPLDIVYVPFADVSSGLKGQYDLIEKKDYLVAERIWMDLLGRAGCEMCNLKGWNYENVRQIRLGKSDVANGWTDGETYIAVGRAFLKELDLDVAGFTRLGALLVHEYSHEQADTVSHPHDQAFYERAHDLSRDRLPEFIAHCVRVLPSSVKAVGKTLTKTFLRDADKLTAARREMEKILAVLEGKELQLAE